MKKKPQRSKRVWYMLNMTVIRLFDKSVQLAMPEDLEMGIDIPDLDVASLPFSQIQKVRVGGKYDLDTRVFEASNEVEAEPTALDLGMHITAIKLPKWLGDKNEMTPLDQIYDTTEETEETPEEEISVPEEAEVETESFDDSEASVDSEEVVGEEPEQPGEEEEVEEIEW